MLVDRAIDPAVSCCTVNGAALAADVSSARVTVTGPVTAPAGTATDSELPSAAMVVGAPASTLVDDGPVKATSLAPVRPVPLTCTTAPTRAKVGAKPSTV